MTGDGKKKKKEEFLNIKTEQHNHGCFSLMNVDMN